MPIDSIIVKPFNYYIMKVFSIFLNNNDSLLIVCANNENEAIALIFSDEDSPMFEREEDINKISIDCYEEKTLLTKLDEPTLISWVFNEPF